MELFRQTAFWRLGAWDYPDRAGAARELRRRGLAGASEPPEAGNCELRVNVLDFSAFFSKKQAGFVQYFSAFSKSLFKIF